MNKAVVIIIAVIMVGAAVAFFTRNLSGNFSIKRQANEATDFFNAKIKKSTGDLVEAVKGKAEQLWEDNATSLVDGARQKTADKIQDLATVISGNSSSSSDLEAEYNKAKADYLQKIADFGSQKSSYGPEEIKKIQKDLETEFASLEKIMTKSLEALKRECGI
ncbi:MAG: hypothetical protein V1819_00290 [bacterium]